MKKIEWGSPDKMKIETLHKGFNEQTNIISTGNIVANTIIGARIRSWYDKGSYEKEPKKEGQLFKFDIESFLPLPFHISNYLEKVAKDKQYEQGFWLYHIFNQTKTGRVTHGYIVTLSDHTLLRTFVTTVGYKSANVIEVCSKYLSN